jgi:ATP-dependent protease Clp ATPase subunit
MWFRKLRCSFCRRSDQQVAKLVAGARGYICDRCAYETIRIMEATPPSGTTTGARAAVPAQRASDWNRTWHFATAND